MRYYGFTNMYLSSIQVGIQNAHCLVNIGREYDDTELTLSGVPAYVDYADWADNHKTMICLNGGNQADLQELGHFFEDESNPYAWSCFYEDEQSLNGCLTCVGIILSERIYETSRIIKEDRSGIAQLTLPADLELSIWELELIQLLPNFRLAH